MGDTAGGFGPFILDSIFAQGADGLTYRAHRGASGDAALLRVPAMPEEWEEAARFRDRFVARANGVRALRGPGILEIRDVGFDEASGMPYIAYEPVEGADLRELTAHGRRVADAEIARIGAAVAEALDHAHAAGFVHGSLTPACVLVGAGGAVKLAGFGIEPAPGSPTDMRGHAVGSGAYAAPEQIIGGTVDGRADLFALGLVLFEAVTGQHPFLATPPRDVRDRIVADEAPIPGHVRPETPGGFNTILFRLLQKDPAKRPARGAEVAQALRALHERLLHPPAPAAVPAGAPPPHAAAAAARPRVSPLAVVGVVAAAVAIAVLAALVLLRRPAAPPAAAPEPAAALSGEALARAADEVAAALAAEDFRGAERLLADLRRDAPLEPRVLDLGQQLRDRRAAKVERLFAEGVALARQERWRDAERRFAAALEVDPSYVDARDRLEEVAEHLRPERAPRPQQSGAPAPALQRPAATAAPGQRLHLLFRSPLASGEVRVVVDRRPLAPVPFSFAAAEGAAGTLGTVQRSFDMPAGQHHVLVALTNERGLTIGEQAFVLKFEPGGEQRVTIEMATARSLPRFSATALR